MKLKDILGRIGRGVVRDVVPGGGLILDAVNAVLPGSKKLGPSASGNDIIEATAGLPADQRAAIMEKSFDVELAEQVSMQTMLSAEQNSQHTTRPRIALGSFYTAAAIAAVFVLMWAYSVAIRDGDLTAAIMAGWPFVVALISLFMAPVGYYFGVLKNEQRNRLNAAAGHSTQGLVGGILKNLTR